MAFCDLPRNWSVSFQNPATPLMEGIIALHSDIWAIMLFVAVFVLYILSSVLNKFNFAKVNKSYKVHHNSMIEIIWTTLPALLLCVIAIPSFTLLYSLDEIVDPSVTIKVIGRQWYWSAPYADSELGGGGIIFDSYLLQDDLLEAGQLRLLEVDNRLVLPVNSHIRLLTSSADVIHSFAVPSLGIKLDAIPGRLNQTTFLIKREGCFYGQCSELCGASHALMPICVESVGAEDYINWINTKLDEA
uniref:cytochrome c oxidase subunit 2 n=1 Tax=Gayralia brasiliensis TaxID=1286870 RepID=UPI002410DDFF|nr:cytochrome c oxidase subunit 2 [Gayralia brasiliensis]YP_010733839.1 cytochrome c oxidase subunit 2 [Monostroma nitidum]WEG93081.1 cytochrome c oxidase subunit 2 [Gayralia brasiliensis]WEG93110.1 cytochrome c oxidase subunit 2 [Monostroma nitidum]